MHFSAFINPRRACAGGLRYLSCLSVCLSVCLFVCLLPLSCRHRSFLRPKYGTYGTRLGFPSFLTRGFSKKPSVGKLWREKANCK